MTNITSGLPTDWSDKHAWNRHFTAELQTGRIERDPEPIVLRFLSFAHEKGGRIWFPGCGLDQYPKAYAERGCRVLATDWSSVAVEYQRARAAGAFVAMEHDFTHSAPGGEFDVVINCRAFQGLSSSAMDAAAGHFHAALRPGGACILDTMNVQGDRRNMIEDSLIGGGFYLPFQGSERWYRQALESTGLVYGMVLGRPHIQDRDQYPPGRFRELAERDQQILDSFSAEYARRRQEEAADVEKVMKNPATIVAHVVYATG